jgi:hypothetical protein
MRGAASLLVTGALVLAACEDATAPIRAGTYEFNGSAVGVCGQGEVCVFRWQPARLPVRYWVAPAAGPVPGYVEAALRTWEAQFLYGEFTGVMVGDSARADVLVFVGGPTPPDVPLTNDPPVPACDGVTSFDITGPPDQIDGAFRISLNWDFRYGDTDVANCLSRVAAHEVGHTLGLFVHSPNPLDLMNAYPTVTVPSLIDRSTLELLYHTPSTIEPPARAP